MQILPEILPEIRILHQSSNLLAIFFKKKLSVQCHNEDVAFEG